MTLKIQTLAVCLFLATGQVSAQESPPPPELNAEELEYLTQEFEPPKEAPYTTETDPVTAQPVAIPKAGVNQDAPVTYETEKTSVPPTQYRQDGLKKVTAKGEYIYDVRNTDQSFAGSLKFGGFSPLLLKNKLDNGNNILFSDIYGAQSQIMVNLDIEWQFLKTAGKMGLKAGTGLMTAKGNGRFKRDPTLESREIYTFFLAPNSLSLVYRAQYSPRQLFVPYGFGGAYYYTFLESRDDNAPFKYGGALAAMAGGGIQFQLDSLDRKAINEMDREYGVNHVWLVAEYQQIFGLSTKFDFSGQYVNGGVLVEF